MNAPLFWWVMCGMGGGVIWRSEWNERSIYKLMKKRIDFPQLPFQKSINLLVGIFLKREF